MSRKTSSTRAILCAWVLGAAAGCPGAPATPGDDGGASTGSDDAGGSGVNDDGGTSGNDDGGQIPDVDGGTTDGGGGTVDGGGPADGGTADGGAIDDGGTPTVGLGLSYFLPSHDVRATHLEGTTLYVGGMFNRMQAKVGPFAAVSADGGGAAQNVTLGPQLTGSVSAAVALDDGSAILVGSFTTTGDVSLSGLAKVGPNGIIDPTWIPDPGYPAVTATADSDAIYVAQTTFAHMDFPLISKINLDTGDRVDWGALFSQTDTPTGYINVRAMKVVGERLYVAGNFTAVNGEARPGIAAFDKEGNLDATFAPAVDQLDVNALESMGNTLLVGGDFSIDDGNGGTRVDLLGLDLETGALSDWAPGTTGVGRVNALAVDGDRVFVGGLFNQFNGEWRRALVAVDAAGALTDWRLPVGDNPSFPWGPVTGHVTSFAIKDGVIYAGGSLEIYDLDSGTLKSNNAFAADLVTGELIAWGPSPGDGVTVVVPVGEHIGIGGTFQTMGGEARTGAAAIDLVTGSLLPFDPLAGKVGSIAVWEIERRGEEILLGGYFGNGARPELVVAQPITGEVIEEVEIEELQGWGTTEIALVGDRTCIAGNGQIPINTPSSGRVVCLDDAGNTVLSATFNNFVWDIAEFEGDLLVGGVFTAVDGEPTGPLARLGPDGQRRDWSPDFSPIPDLTGYGGVSSIEVIDGVIYVSGDIEREGVRQGIVSVNADASLGEFVVPRPSTGLAIFRLETSGSDLLAGSLNKLEVYTTSDPEPVRTFFPTGILIPYGAHRIGEVLIVGGSSGTGQHITAGLGVP